MDTVFNHPGLILDLVSNARAGKPYPLHALYDGDGVRALNPTADFSNAFTPISVSSGPTPHFSMAYERGFLHALKDEIAPRFLPEDRFGVRCAPIAVSLAKLTGEDVRYGYAWNLKTGDDLVKALATQNGKALAFGDVGMTIEGRSTFLHFPSFYGFDPKTNTVALQEWMRPETRVSVSKIRFADSGRDRPAMYFRPHEGLAPFLTPENEPRTRRLGECPKRRFPRVETDQVTADPICVIEVPVEAF